MKTKQVKNEHSKKKNKAIYNIALLLLFVVFFTCAIYLFNYFYSSYKSERAFNDLKDYVDADIIIASYSDAPTETIQNDETGMSEDFIDIDGRYILKKFANLYIENRDFIGWITIEDTSIDYPVMQSLYDEEYYIDKDFYGNPNSSGTLFADTSSDISKPSDVVLIYGHNMKAGTMFQNLLKYEDESFYKEHKYINFDTIYGSGRYEVIAAFRDEIYDEGYTGIKYYDFFEAQGEAEYKAYVSYCKSKTPYKIDSTAEYGDKLLCLSTCAYHSDNGRYVILAKRCK